MAFKIIDEVVQATAVDTIKDNLLKAQDATGGAISVGKGIHKGDFFDKTFFANFGNPTRRDPNTQTAVTPNTLSTLDDTIVKLYFKDDVFITKTQMKRYGSSLESFNAEVGRQLGSAISRWAIQKALIAGIGAITSQSELVAGDGTADPSVGILNESMFKLGDAYEDVKVFVAPSYGTYKLLGDAINSTADQISYGAVYDGTAGTLGRKLWTVDNAALNWVDGDNSGHYILGLTEGALSVDESEIVEILSQLDTLNSNAGYNFHSEGGYSVKVKGFSYDKAQGANPTDAILADTASWDLISQIKQSAGVLAKTK